MRPVTCSVLSVLLAATLMAQVPAPEGRRNFVACPIMRDTKTSPCWLAEYNGETYFLGAQGGVSDDFHPPQLDHKVLVEGTVTPGPRVCGGIPLRPVKVSVLEEIAPACNTMLPAEDGINAPPPQPRGAPDSWVKKDGDSGLTLYFEFDDDFFSVPATNALSAFVKDFKAQGASRIEVDAFRGATLLSDGKVLNERAGLAQDRLAKVVTILTGLGVPEQAISARASDALPQPDGVNDQRSRRVVLSVRP
jgi:hypothetical protein